MNIRSGFEQPSETAQLRALIGVQAMAIEGLARRLAAAEVRLADLAQIAQPDIPAGPRPTLVAIAKMVQSDTGVSVADMQGARRTRAVTLARSIFCATSRRAGYSLHQIGGWLGRDHTTVMAASRKEADARAFFDGIRAVAEAVAA